MDRIFAGAEFMRYALDAIPAIVVVADEDVRILYRNQAGRALLKGEKIYGNRFGEVMRCIHSADVPEGCGHGPRCADCLVRKAVNSVFAGNAVRRARTDIDVKIGKETLKIPALISASGFAFEGRTYSLLVIEDISELIDLRPLLPVCASCKSIHAPDGQWEKMETYLKRNGREVGITHGLCPACSQKLYPDYNI